MNAPLDEQARYAGYAEAARNALDGLQARNGPPMPIVPGDEVLRGWFRHQLFEQCKVPGSKAGGLLLGAPIWGAPYIRRFARYCLPSLLAGSNMEVLAGARLILFSDRAGLAMLYELTEALGLSRVGIVPEFIEIPPDVMQMTRGQHKYLVLGTIQNLLPQIAKRHGMGFHFLMPDHVYNPQYFENLDKLGQTHHAVTQLCTSMQISDAADTEINAFRKGPTLAIPGPDLARLGWRHLHPQTRGALLTDAPDRMPHMHLVAWVGKDRLRMHCPHQNPAWLSPQACQLAPMVAPITLDAELPMLIKGRPFHVAKPEDGLQCVEVSDEGKPGVEQKFNFDQFTYNLWIQSNFEDDGMRFFAAGTEIEIGDEAPPWWKDANRDRKKQGLSAFSRWSEAATEAQLAHITKGLWEGQGRAAIAFAKNVTRKVRIGL